MHRIDDWLTDDRLQELLAEWVERREAGEDVSADDLCADDPHLVQRLTSAMEELKQTNWMLDTAGDALIDDLSVAIEESRWTELAETVTAEQLLDRVASISLLPEQTMSEIREQLSTSDGVSAADALLTAGFHRFN